MLHSTLETSSILWTAPISDSAVQPEPSGVYSSCSRSKPNSVYKRLLHRSLHKSSRVHLMRSTILAAEIYIQVMTPQKAPSRCCYQLSFGFSCCRGHFLYKPLHAKYINFILQRREAGCRASP